MDFKQICDVLGGTIFYEEFCGNLNECRHRIQVMESAVPDSAKTSAVVLWAIYEMMVGQLDKARERLQSLLRRDLSERWNLRCEAYLILVENWRAFPPLFRPRSFVRNIPLQIWQTKKWSNASTELAQSCRKRQKESGVCASDMVDLLELGLLLGLHELFPLVATAVHRGIAKQINISRHLSIEKFELLGGIASTIDLPAVALSIHRLLYNIEYMCRSQSASARLQAWKEAAATHDSHHAHGLLEMREGDDLFWASFDNPFFPSIVVIEPWDYIGSETAHYCPLLKPTASSGEFHP
ncbi:hypothetical protein G7Z17_g5681 [Cylindrodendrum hubeiense]|uniref:Uncharacterized protein n=1 Tax=Cylindrodendrum hubeiense TaxID=595255 RepID=A0A9P5L8W0_9HYPO|nr:hypothetical protein G7Z17_g5681 [Cylindrodendrum hubeiense]